jgi:SH3-like domain-containing protein
VHSAPRAARITGVQQVAPFTSPVTHPAPSTLGHSTPGRARVYARARHTPVVKAPHTAQRKAKPTPPHAAAAAAAAGAAVGLAVGKPGAAAPAAPEPTPPDRDVIDPTTGTVTGMTMPRWVALRSAEVNMRSGPGTRYPVEWQYHRRNLPVKLEREFEVWRLVEDQDGVKGWVHQANLTSQRGFVLTGPEQTLRARPSDTANAVALIKHGVLGRIAACEAQATWCQVRVGNYSGWLKRDVLWGIFPGEAIGN